jgi:hypothetical protein
VRLRTGAVYITLTSAGVLINDITTVIMLSATAAICAGEFYYILRNDAKLPNEAIGIAAAICYPIAMWWAGLKGVAAVTFILLLVLLVWYTYWMRSRITDVCITLFGAMYTGLMLSGIIVIRQALPEPSCLFVSLLFQLFPHLLFGLQDLCEQFTGGNAPCAGTENNDLLRPVRCSDGHFILSAQFMRCLFNILVGCLRFLCKHNINIMIPIDTFLPARYLVRVKHKYYFVA